MITYKELISRADTTWLQDQVGEMTVKVIQVFYEKGINLHLLKQLFMYLVSPYDLLANVNTRNNLFELLRVEEVVSLASDLDLTEKSFDALYKIQMNRGSKKFNSCCSFFGLSTEVKAIHEPQNEIESVIPGYGLYEHQQAAVESVQKCLDKKPNRVVLHMPTGAGKTRMSMHIVCQHLIKYPKSTVLWLANSEELCDQAAEEFLKAWFFLGNRKVNLYRFWGNRQLDFNSIDEGFFVGGFPKLYSLAKRNLTELANLGDKTSLVIVDEAHMVIAPTYSLIIEGVTARKFAMPLLGLTATPGRTWNDPDTDVKLSAFFKKQKVTLTIHGYSDPVQYLVDNGYLARPNFRKLQYISDNLSDYDIKSLAQDLDVPASILKKLAGDERRSVMIIRELESMLERHSRIIVFATTVTHAGMLTAILNIRGHQAKCITAESPSNQRVMAIDWFKSPDEERKIIINYGVLTTGFDAPQTSAALIARPTKSLVLYSQMVGRAVRGKKAGGNEEAEIVTVVDTNLPGFGNLQSAFTNWEDVW